MIGVFDSGLGGLTGLYELKRLLPDADIVYFGDTGRVPYGSKSADTIIRYSLQDMAFLSTFGIDAALVACGTASSTALEELKKRYTIPIFGVIEPAAKEAAEKTRTGKVGVICTQTTKNSGSFERAVRRLDDKIDVLTVACPLFVHLVENGFSKAGDTVTREVARRYLSAFDGAGVDVLILGCTHYPIISWAIAEAMPGVELISSGRAAAKALADAVGGTQSGAGTVRFYVTDSPESFESSAGAFMGGDFAGHAEQIDISKY